MKRFMIFFILIPAAAMVFSCKSKEPKSSCISGYQEEIPKEKFEPILQASAQMVRLLQEGNIDDLYETGTEEMRKSQTRDQFAFTVDMFVKTFGPVDYPRAEEVYYMESEARQDQVWISCNLGEPGINDLYGMPANRELAVVIYKARTDLELVRVIFQLEKKDEQWRLRSLVLNPATIKHKLPDYYMTQALKFREQNLLHLAVLYYKTAILLHDLGINIDEFSVKVLQEQMNQIKVDYMPGGQIQIWSVPSGASYKVYNLDVAFNKGDLLVHLSYMTESLEDKEKLETQARELAEFMDRKFPEYRKGFDGIKVTAASEKREELMISYHSVVMFKDLEQ